MYRYNTEAKIQLNRHLNNKGQEWKKRHTKRRVLMGGGVNEEGKKKKKVNMVDVLSIQVWIWNIKTCWNHLKKRTKVERRIIEGMNQFEVWFIYIQIYIHIHLIYICIYIEMS
jgi:hypothetical protein